MGNKCIFCEKPAGRYHICDDCYENRQRSSDKKIILAAFGIVVFIVCLLLCGFISGRELKMKQSDYILESGDTLWELYEENCSNVKWDKWMHEMRKINNKERCSEWYAGEKIILLCAE